MKTSNAYKRRRTKRKLIVTISIVAFVIVTVGLGLALYFINKIRIDNQNKDKDQQEQPQVPAEAQIVRIELTKNPKSQYYTSDTAFNAEGGQITVYFDDNTRQVVNLTNSMITTPWDGIAGKDRKAIITYRGKTCNFFYTVEAVAVKEIRIKTNPATKYYTTATDFDVANGQITVYYNNNTSKVVSITNEMITTEWDGVAGTGREATISYEGKTCSFFYDVVEIGILKIEIANSPVTKYTTDDTDFDVTGGRITVYYDNNTTEDIDITRDMIKTAWDGQEGTDRVAVIEYEDKTCTFSYDVTDVKVSYIVVTKNPVTKYTTSDTDFDVTGGQITVYYTDETSEVVNITRDMIKTSWTGVAGVGLEGKIEYRDKECSFFYDVYEIQITHIALTKSPDRIHYTSSTGFNIANGQVTVYFEDGNSETVNLTADMIETEWTGAVGTNLEGTIKYRGKECTFFYDVLAVEVDEISLLSNIRDVYLDFETAFDLNGAQIQVAFNDGSKETVSVANYLEASQFATGNIDDHIAFITGKLYETDFNFTVNYKIIDSLTKVKDITNIGLLTNYLSTDTSFASTTAEDPKMTVSYEFNYADDAETKTLSRDVNIVLTGDDAMITAFENDIPDGETTATYQATITYGNKTVNFDYTVEKESILELNVLGTATTSADTVQVVDVSTGELVETPIAELESTDLIALPTPAATYTPDTTARKYFIGWSTEEDATVPDYYVGEDYVALSEAKTVLHAVYVEADETKWEFTPNDESNTTSYTAAYNSETLGEDGILVVPNIYNDLPVTAVTQRVATVDTVTDVTDVENTSVKRVIIANGVEAIEEKAFVNCTALTNVVFTPSDSKVFTQAASTANVEVENEVMSLSSVMLLEERVDEPTITSIGVKAFRGCTSIQSVTIPKSVTELGSEAFYGCTALTSVNFEEGIALQTIGAAAFRDCTALKGIVIPATVETIGDLAFQNCKGLTSVVVEEGSALTRIGSKAFSGISTAEGIEKYTISFANCTSLVEIGHESFRYMGAVKELYFPKELKTISGDHNFSGSLIEVCDFGGADSQMEGKWTATFRGCPNLKSIYVPAGIDQLAVKTFEDCKSLKEVKFHEDANLSKHSVEYITGLEADTWPNDGYQIRNYYYAYLFQGCESLEEITLPMGMQTLDVYTFGGCTSLKKVTFKDPIVQFRACLTDTDSQIFYNCTSLETVEFAEGTTVNCYNLGAVWNGALGYRTVTLNYNASEVAGLFSNCSSLKYVGIPNAEGKIEENTLPGYNKVHNSMLRGTAIENFTIPEGLTEISAWAFAGCRQLRYIDIPSTVTTIKNQAFTEAGLLSLVLPENVKNVEKRAFWCMETLASIEIRCKELISGGEIFQAEYKEGETYLGLPTNLSVITFADTCEKVQFTTSDFSRCSNNLIVVFERTVDDEGNISPTLLNDDSISLLRLSGQIKFYMASAAADEYREMFETIVDNTGRSTWIAEQKAAWIAEQKATWIAEQKAEWLAANTDKTEDDWVEVEATYLTQYEESILATHDAQYESGLKATHEAQYESELKAADIVEYNETNGVDYVLKPLGV